MPKGIKIAEVTWVEVAKAFKNNWPVVIPLGAACKEHGFHLPMNTDFLQAEYLANDIVENYEVVVAPTISYSHYPAFVAYAGSSSLSREITCESLVQICNDWHKQGAQKFYVLNTGISTNKPLQDAKEQLNSSGIVFEYLNLSSLYKDKRILDITQQKVGTHADEIETSIMEKAQPEENGGVGPLTPDSSADPEKYTFSYSGAWGNPTLATKEKGKIAIDIIKDMIDTGLKPLLEINPTYTFNDFKIYIEGTLKKVDLFLDPEILRLIYNTHFTDIKPNKNSKIIILGGGSGTGKTTYRKNYLRKGLAENYYVHDVDEILLLLPGYQEALKKDNPEMAFKTWIPIAQQIANSMMEFAVKNKFNVVYDHTCRTEASYFALKHAHDMGYFITLYGFYTEEEKALQRVQERATREQRSISKDIVCEYLYRFSTLWPQYLKFVDEAFLLNNNELEQKIVFSLQKKKCTVLDYDMYKKFLSMSYGAEEAIIFKFPNIPAMLDDMRLQAYQKKKGRQGLFFLTAHSIQPHLLEVVTLKNNPQYLEKVALWGEEKWGYLRGFPGLARRKELLSALADNFYIIHYQKTPIGMFALVDEDNSVNELKFKKLMYVYIDEPFRGLGLGKKIVDMAKQLAKKDGFIIIFDTLHPNLNQFYEKQGARVICEGETLGYPATVLGIFKPTSNLPMFKKIRFDLPNNYHLDAVKKEQSIVVTLCHGKKVVGKAQIVTDNVDVACITDLKIDNTHSNHLVNGRYSLGEVLLKFLIKFPTMVRKPQFRFILNVPDNLKPIVEKRHFDRGVGSNLENTILIRKQAILPETHQILDGITFKTTIAPNQFSSLLSLLKKNAYWQSHLTLERLYLLVNQSDCFFAISDKNEIIGFSRVLTDHVSFASLWDVVVDETHRGKGIGIHLMLQIFSNPVLSKITNWVLFTDTAKKLYEKFGFVAEKDIPNRTLVHKLRLQDSHPNYMKQLIEIAGEGLSIHLNENQTLEFLFGQQGKRANLPNFWSGIPHVEPVFQNSEEVLKEMEKLRI